MAGSYELWLTTDGGARIAALDWTLGFQCSRVVNGIGTLNMQLPATFDGSLLARDRMIQVWRAPTGGRLGLWRPYFVLRWQFATDASGNAGITVWGWDANHLLTRRIAAHYAGSSNVSKTSTEADDLMKDAVTDAIADGSNPAPSAGTRVWSGLSVAGDLTAGPQLDKDFAWSKLLTMSGGGVIADLADAAREAGTEVFWDVAVASVSPAAITFEFRTYTGQPGMDVSDWVVFDESDGNLIEPFLEYDYSQEENYEYAAGQGEGTEREIQQVYDSTRYGASRWARCEGFADARNQKTANGVREAGRLALTEGRPVRRFGGTPVDTAGTRFGRDWDVGYKVRARYRNQEFDAIVRSGVLTVRNGQETIQARLEYEG